MKTYHLPFKLMMIKKKGIEELLRKLIDITNVL